MTARTIIALSAYKGSGKDTVADHLVSRYGFMRISFAAKLKDMVAEIYNIDRVSLDSQVLKEQPLYQYPVISTDATTSTMHHLLRAELSSGFWTPRALCILEGSMKRAVHSNYWVRNAVAEIGSSYSGRFVITDMRYKSEADTVRMLYPETEIFRIRRFDTSPTTDPSERDMDDYSFDKYLKNTGTKEELYEQIDSIIGGKFILDHMR